jgi:adenosylcobinamide-GDP ribazoletransferase
MFLSNEVAILISMIATILLTGAFHEDGFADVCDGFGGGWTRAQKLSIMKDSRLGTYGAIGLIMILLLKYMLLVEMPIAVVFIALILAHSLSRVTPLLIIYSMQYVREDQETKAKPVARGVSVKDITLSVLLIIPFFGLIDYRSLYLFLLPIPMAIALRWFFNKHLGGYTGDCLGASQQISELVYYVSIPFIWISL